MTAPGPAPAALRFDDRVIAITGAAQGMGRAYALFLAERGARVLVNDLAGAAETVALVRAAGGEVLENRADITDPQATDALVAAALARWGRLDGVVNNAALYGGTLESPERTAAVIGVHLFGTINMIRSAMPAFRSQGYGRIVNVASGSLFGLPGVGTYAAGKGGVFGFTRSLARDLDSAGEGDIRANTILPAALTPTMPRVPDAAFQAMLDAAFTCEAIAPMVALLLHEACPSQGEAFHVGGGRQARILFATTEGWQAPGDTASPEEILANWSAVMANADPREPEGSMADFLARRGLPAYSTMELVSWARTGQKPPARE
jgi:NAD(P)-dependent dehydrogenase (short-subunit alcohol dehydrogenase family)